MEEQLHLVNPEMLREAVHGEQSSLARGLLSLGSPRFVRSCQHAPTESPKPRAIWGNCGRPRFKSLLCLEGPEPIVV